MYTQDHCKHFIMKDIMERLGMKNRKRRKEEHREKR